MSVWTPDEKAEAVERMVQALRPAIVAIVEQVDGIVAEQRAAFISTLESIARLPEDQMRGAMLSVLDAMGRS